MVDIHDLFLIHYVYFLHISLFIIRKICDAFMYFAATQPTFRDENHDDDDEVNCVGFRLI